MIQHVFVNDERKAAIRRRLRRVRGQVDGIDRMLGENRPCVEILQQMAAAREALGAAGKLMIRNYVEKCMTNGIRTGREKRVQDELLEIVDKMVR